MVCGYCGMRLTGPWGCESHWRRHPECEEAWIEEGMWEDYGRPIEDGEAWALVQAMSG